MFTPTITPAALAEALNAQGLSEAQQQELLDAALDALEPAFEHAWRVVPEATANDCVVRVARSQREGRKSANAGQLAKVANGDRVAAARAHADPLESVRHVLARYVVPL